jgi:undecaprenyl phosphate N,N'-diacetylbacillosamine 1-phosphate transferase
MIYKLYLKRIFDFLVSVLILILFFPIMVLISLTIISLDGKPIIFKQERVGRNLKKFNIFKFRTLSLDGKEIKYIGNFLRKSKLDEILNFLNVILNQMSIVGPRPLKIDYLKHYSSTQIRRHDIKPGIFGLAQIQNNNLDWKKYFKYDLYYLKNYSFILDFWIILVGIKKILFSELRFKTLSSKERFK